MSTILTGVGEFFTAIFGTGSTPGYASQLITWLTSSGNELALVGLYLYILDGTGAHREYIKAAA